MWRNHLLSRGSRETGPPCQGLHLPGERMRVLDHVCCPIPVDFVAYRTISSWESQWKEGVWGREGVLFTYERYLLGGWTGYSLQKRYDTCVRRNLVLKVGEVTISCQVAESSHQILPTNSWRFSAALAFRISSLKGSYLCWTFVLSVCLCHEVGGKFWSNQSKVPFVMIWVLTYIVGGRRGIME